MQPSALPAEMLIPNVLPWTEQPDYFICHWINTGNIRPLVHVAGKTRPGQVLEFRRTAMFLSDDVIQVKREIGHLLRQATILTSTSSLCNHLPFQFARRSRHDSCCSLLQRNARAGLHQFQGPPGFLEALQFNLLCFIQFSSLGLFQEHTHPITIVRRERKTQNSASRRFVPPSRFRLNDTA